MTEPTDAEIRDAWEQYNPMHGIESFARAVLAKWGQPAQAAEPFCWQWENTFNGGTGAVKKNPETLGINMSHPDYKWTALYTTPRPTQPDPAYSEACHLATALFKKHFAHLPDYASGRVVWGLCDSTAGVISQIDNMVSCLVQPPTTSLQAADSVLEDAARLDFLIEQQAYVVSDPDACPGHWLHWARPDGSTWVQGDEHPTPRAAIDAARKQGEKQ